MLYEQAFDLTDALRRFRASEAVNLYEVVLRQPGTAAQPGVRHRELVPDGHRGLRWRVVEPRALERVVRAGRCVPGLELGLAADAIGGTSWHGTTGIQNDQSPEESESRGSEKDRNGDTARRNPRLPPRGSGKFLTRQAARTYPGLL